MVERRWICNFEFEKGGDKFVDVLTPEKPISCLSNIPNQCYNNNATLDLELERMKFKIKEMEVLKIHKNKITYPTNTYNAYKTRVTGAKNNQIVRKTYEALIEALYEYYFGDKKEVLTLGECIRRWISSREENEAVSYLTTVHYRSDYNKFIYGTELDKTDITKITKAQFISFLEKLVGDGKMRKSTFNNIKTVLNGGFNYANMLDGYDCIDTSKIRTADILKRCYEPDNKDDVFTREEVIILLRYLESIPQTVYTLAIRLCFCLSVRIGEIRAIRWVKYDEVERLIRLDHSMVTKKTEKANRETVCVEYMKKHSNAGKRTLQVSDYAALVLDELKGINGDKEFILQSAGLKPISTNQFNEHLKKYCQEAGIQYHSSHKIRFYACSNMYENDVDERTIQYNMGHEEISTTRHYDRRKHKKLDNETVNKVFGFALPADLAERV